MTGANIKRRDYGLGVSTRNSTSSMPMASSDDPGSDNLLPTPQIDCYTPTRFPQIHPLSCRTAIADFVRDLRAKDPTRDLWLWTRSHSSFLPADTIHVPLSWSAENCKLTLSVSLDRYWAFQSVSSIERTAARISRACATDGRGLGGWIEYFNGFILTLEYRGVRTNDTGGSWGQQRFAEEINHDGKDRLHPRHRQRFPNQGPCRRQPNRPSYHQSKHQRRKH